MSNDIAVPLSQYEKKESSAAWCSPARHADVTVLVDVAGALSPQLQGDGGQVLGCGLHDQAAHHAVARVEDVIEPLAKELLGLWYATGHHRVELLQHTHTTNTGIHKHQLTCCCLCLYTHPNPTAGP